MSEVEELKNALAEQREYIKYLEYRRAALIKELVSTQNRLADLKDKEIRDSEVTVLLHALGISDPAQEKPYRNFYCTYVDDPLLLGMVERGLMSPDTVINNGKDQYFIVTEKGRELALANKPKPPSRDKKRYLEYLRLADSYNLTFKEYLKNRLYTEVGRQVFFGY